jgi:uncharacterized spore protein YtfJ
MSTVQQELRASNGTRPDGGADGVASAGHDLEALTSRMRADLAFGEARVVGQQTIIPVARVLGGVGAGFGAGGAQQSRGMGGGLRIKPVGAIVVSEGGVSMVPIVDAESIVKHAFGLLALAVALAALARARSRRRGQSVWIGKIHRLASPQISIRRGRG